MESVEEFKNRELDGVDPQTVRLSIDETSYIEINSCPFKSIEECLRVRMDAGVTENPLRLDTPPVCRYDLLNKGLSWFRGGRRTYDPWQTQPQLTS